MMKTKILSLAGLAACVAALSSCAVYDEYGYYDAPVGGGYVDGYDYGYGYSAPYYPTSSVSFFGFGGGYPYRYYGRDHHHYHDHHDHHDHDDHHYGHGSGAHSRSYASRVTRAAGPARSSSLTSPRVPSTRTFDSTSRPSGRRPSISSPTRGSGGSSRPAIRSAPPRVESRPSPSSRPARATTASTSRSSSSSASRDTRRGR